MTFEGATFAFRARFDGATFLHKASFARVRAAHGFDLKGARATTAKGHVWPEGWSVTRTASGSTTPALAEIVKTPVC
ncbi:hypothetical protein AB0M83_26995 [Amycolatopsis sp. NPDC051106]|uniref:hypothetical protein n=1 Tax=unclassified Amycolatopsis TaxID=2618356 RepID=UPI0034478B55